MPRSEAEDKKLIHELHVYQIELEMQNDELVLNRENQEIEVWKYKALFEALHDSEEKYRQISSAVSDYIFSAEVGKNGTVKTSWVGGAFEQITGYTFAEYIACGGWPVHIHPDDQAIDAGDMEKIRSGQRINTELRTIKKDGSIVWVRIYANPVFDSSGTVLIGINGAVQDITKLKLAETELLTLKNELEIKVEEKTKELKERVAELERFYSATIDRELRMKELRDEIELLKSRK